MPIQPEAVDEVGEDERIGGRHPVHFGGVHFDGRRFGLAFIQRDRRD